MRKAWIAVGMLAWLSPQTWASEPSPAPETIEDATTAPVEPALADEPAMGPPPPPAIPAGPTYATIVSAGPIDAAMAHRAQRRKRDQLGGSISLLAWSVGNLGVGAAGWAIADDPQWRAFHRANFLWNTVNAAIAVPSILGAVREQPGTWSLGKLVDEDRKLVLAYGVNTGLDVGYIFAGAFLHEFGQRTGNDDMIGTGWALMAQGGYLLVYDLVMWAIHARQAKKLRVVPEVGQAIGMKIGGSF